MFANNNYHPKSTVVENCVFQRLGVATGRHVPKALLRARMGASARGIR